MSLTQSIKCLSVKLTKIQLLSQLIAIILLSIFVSNGFTEKIYQHIYIDQANGTNSFSTTGTEADPFKSISYAILKNKDTTEPLFIHVKTGVYDANPTKAANEREIFPIELKNGMAIQGDDGVENCIISGAFNSNSKAAILKGQNLSGILIKDLTLKDMNRTSGNGGGCEIINCSGKIEGCVFKSNKSENGGGFYLTIAQNALFDINSNKFFSNSCSYKWGGGFHVNSILKGNVSGNIFNNNSANYEARGGGFCVSGNFTGDIFGNTFNVNSADKTSDSRGGAFCILGHFRGNLYSNTFKGNSGRNMASAFYIIALTGNIYDNLFIGNVGDSVFSVYYNMKGDVSDNIFTGNSESFFIRDDLIGNISNNIFSGNSGRYGSCFNISDLMDGRIDSNVFSKNTASYGGAFYLGNQGGNPVTISNNYFLYNSISGNNKFEGAAFYSKQNVNVLNNTFYGNETNGSCVNITNSASNSIFKNNIFVNSHTAIWEEGELTPPITHNNFYGLTNILYRNNQAMGADSFFIEMLLPETFTDNKEYAPSIIGEDLENGTWTANPSYDAKNNITIFSDAKKDWHNDQWVGAMINLSNSSSTRQHYLIVGNTTTQIKVWGNIASSGLVQQDHIYSIDDYRLAADSQNIDSGMTNSIMVDFENELRPQGGYFDIGADEFYKGEKIPGIALVDPPVKNITAYTATLQAKVNPHALSTTCYFEYSTDMTYNINTSEFSGYSRSGLFEINADISELSPDTVYHFRLVAINDTGTAYGPDQIFKTLPITAEISGKISFAMAGHVGLEVKNAKIILEGTDFETTTNADGEFTLSKIPSANYNLIISAENLLPIEQQVNLFEGQVFDFGVKQMKVLSSEGLEHTIQDAVNAERKRWDAKSDNKKGLPEAINALQTSAGIVDSR